MNRQGLKLSLGLGLAALLLDRAYKLFQIDIGHWAPDHFTPVLPILDVGLIFNTGISYGLLGDLPLWVIGILVIVALCALIAWWWRAASALVRSGLAICIGGALSNGIDRLLYGSVADSFWLHIGGFSFFVFNVADAAITLGVGLLLLDLLGVGGKRAANPA